ncbi:MAG: HEPN domain-containing protein [Thermoplasmata archaeon]|nr:HEPN domain-containing protein [Thermoplasmata archaeon]
MDDPGREWFHKADNDLLNAENNLDSKEIPLDTVCFHSQQATEKYLKGYLIIKGEMYPRIHNLLRLLELCKQFDESFESLREYCLVLNDYGVEIRYPDYWSEPAMEDAKEAYRYAKKVREFVLKRVQDEA